MDQKRVIDPKTRALLITFRQACIMVANAIARYLELPEKSLLKDSDPN